MEPTLHCSGAVGCLRLRGDRVLVERFSYRVARPARGDIVLMNGTARTKRACGGERAYVKRIVGVGGETVAQARGVVLVNGTHLDEPYLPDGARRGRDFAATRIPADHYFLMGDNRAASCDSRAFGPVARAALRGRVIGVYAPSPRLP
jgi:signal peptidase I